MKTTTRVFKGHPNHYYEVGVKAPASIGLNLQIVKFGSASIILRFNAVSEDGALPTFTHFTPRKHQDYSLLDEQGEKIVKLYGVGLNRIRLPFIKGNASTKDIAEFINAAGVDGLVASFVKEQIEKEGFVAVPNLQEVIRELLLPDGKVADAPTLALEFPTVEEFHAVGKKVGEYFYSKASAHSDGWNDDPADDDPPDEDDEFDVDE